MDFWEDFFHDNEAKTYNDMFRMEKSIIRDIHGKEALDEIIRFSWQLVPGSQLDGKSLYEALKKSRKHYEDSRELPA